MCIMCAMFVNALSRGVRALQISIYYYYYIIIIILSDLMSVGGALSLSPGDTFIRHLKTLTSPLKTHTNDGMKSTVQNSLALLALLKYSLY